MTTIDQIKARWPLSAMLARCGIDIPAKGKFRSPFREDNNPSCEIYGEVIKDRSTGETWDVIAVFAEINQLSNADAIKRLAAELPSRAPKVVPMERKFVLPQFHYSPEAADRLCSLRGFSRESVDFAAVTIGSLGFGEFLGFGCWFLHDSRNIAEARRLDGELFPTVGGVGERKSHTIAGSKKSFPIGLNPRHGSKTLSALPIMLVEGGPDYLAACNVSWYMEELGYPHLPVAMLGSSQGIHTLSLPFFKGRQVLIVSQPDDAGLRASKVWAKQLFQAGAKDPVVQQLVGGDLNDLVKRDGAESVAKGIK